MDGLEFVRLGVDNHPTTSAAQLAANLLNKLTKEERAALLSGIGSMS
ncbi:hypothetical protein [Methylomonas rapida]|uniref:Uncharacterized protein n=1 Tax=Methylomonas rapida TaxID=2963939 RepID=A0ABY7GEM0_9GAMM|nr:hypothetical protein [Methylomonas rapida]WAR43737.1 hypothetical protein NM686_015300 [Methylomonas rapida]